MEVDTLYQFAANNGSTANARKRKNAHPLLVAKPGKASSSRNATNYQKRKNTHHLLVARPEEASSSRNVIMRYAPASSNTRRANANRNDSSVNSQNVNLNSARGRDDAQSYKDLDEGTLNPEIVQGLIHVLDEHNGLVRLFITTCDRCNADEIPGFKIRLYNMGGIRGGDREGIAAGSKIMLPSTFTGGPRYMYSHNLDALGIRQSLGNPQFFITFTCNVKWPKIKRYMAQYPELTVTDRADIVCRVFEQKVKDFVKFLKEVRTFGYVSAGIGPDHVLAKISNSEASTSAPGNRTQIDEIQNYVDGRFICLYKACWRIFDFLIHCREPAMQILNVHLVDTQCVNFREWDRLDIIVNIPKKKKTTLTEWLTYVHPNSGDLFYFWMLLCHQKGCKSSIEVRTVNGQILPTYRATYETLGLLEDDKEWDIALQESTALATLNEIRILFAQILICYDIADPLKLWTKHWKAMRDDIPTKISKETGISNYHVNTAELQGYILYELEAILNGFGKSMTDFGLQPPPQHLLKYLQNKLLIEEKNYKRNLLTQDAATPTAGSLQEKVIVHLKNVTANDVNSKILSNIEGKSIMYLSDDEAIPMGRETIEIELLYPMEYLNAITFLGFMPHELELKIQLLSCSGNIVEFTMWDELAKQFNKEEVEKLTLPVIIFVMSSYKIQREYDLHTKPWPKVLENMKTRSTHRATNVAKVQHKYNFKATVTDGPRMHSSRSSQMPARKLPPIPACSKKHIFQIHFAPSTRAGAGRFIVDDILDIQPSLGIHNTDTSSATSSTATTKDSTNKDKGISGNILAINPTGTTNEPTNKDKDIPGIHYYSNNKALPFLTSNIIHATDTDT
ncbi:DNA helicase [Tanacetum coccineum]